MDCYIKDFRALNSTVTVQPGPLCHIVFVSDQNASFCSTFYQHESF